MEDSTDVTYILVEEFIITMVTPGGDASWINGNNEQHNRNIHNIVIEGLIDSNRHETNGIVQHKHQIKYIYEK